MGFCFTAAWIIQNGFALLFPIPQVVLSKYAPDIATIVTGLAAGTLSILGVALFVIGIIETIRDRA